MLSHPESHQAPWLHIPGQEYLPCGPGRLGPGPAGQTQQGPTGPPVRCWTVRTRGYCVLTTAAGEDSAPSVPCGVTAWLPVGGRCPKQAASSHQKAACDAAGIRPPVTARVHPMQTAIGGIPLKLDQKFLSSSFVTASLAWQWE